MTITEIILIVILCLIIISIFIFILALLKKISKKDNLVDNTDTLQKIGVQIKDSLETQHKKDMEMILDKIDTSSKNNKDSIEDIKKIVTEDLNKSVSTEFNKSFKAIGEQLTKMQTTAGELKTFGSSADKLLKAMKNVKISGIFGEVQLSNILEQFLTPNQYSVNFQAKENQDRVEFAIKFPTNDNKNNNKFVYLPIDSKFPYNVFTDLIAAQEKGDENTINLKLVQLKQTVIKMAKDIHNKYINPPLTTTYAIMFLSTESLYVEVIKMGLLERIQQEYQVTIAGPTTISAMLISFMMAFKSIKIQQDASNIITTISALKAQFTKMEDELKKVSDGFDKSTKGFHTLLGTRFRMIRSKINSIDEMPLPESDKLIGVNDVEQIKQIEAEEADKNNK